MNERVIIKSRRQGRNCLTADARLWETEPGGGAFDVVLTVDQPDSYLGVTDVCFRVEDMLPLAEMIIEANLYRKGGKHAKKLLPIAKMIAGKNLINLI